jgi:hypothetical protein
MCGFGEMAEWFKAAVLKTACREHRHPASQAETRTNLRRNKRVRYPFAQNRTARIMAQSVCDRAPLTKEVIAAFGRLDRMSGPERTYAPKPRPVRGVVYFIGGNDGPVKIGFTNHLEHRLATLRCSSPVPLGVLATVEGPPELERDYHRRFAAHRLHGEWFARCPEIEAEIERLTTHSGRRVLEAFL